jgi:hypothetical protein
MNVISAIISSPRSRRAARISVACQLVIGMKEDCRGPGEFRELLIALDRPRRDLVQICGQKSLGVVLNKSRTILDGVRVTSFASLDGRAGQVSGRLAEDLQQRLLARGRLVKTSLSGVQSP